MRAHRSRFFPAVLHHGRRIFPLCRRLQQPADQLLPLYERFPERGGLPGQHLCRGTPQHLFLGDRPGQRRYERLFILPVRLALLLVLATVPAAVAALPDGAAAGAQVRRGGRRCVPVPEALRQELGLRRAGCLPVCTVRLCGVQRVLQPLCGCGGPVPVPAVGAGRGHVQQAPRAVCLLGGGEPAQQLLLFCRAGGVPGHLLCVQAHHRRLPPDREAVCAAGV